MRFTIDISPWVHHHGGLGRYAGALTSGLVEQAPWETWIGLYHSSRRVQIGDVPRELITARVPLGAKPWRMSVLLAYLARFNLDIWMPPSDLFHATDHLLPPLGRARTVFTIHDLIFRFYPEYHLPLNRWYLTLMLPGFLERADAVIAVSEQTRRDVVRLMNISPDKLTVIYEGVSPHFRPIQNPVELERVRSKYKLPTRFLLFFSTLEPRKNLVTLLDAYAALLKQDDLLPPLVIAGRKGWLYESTIQHIRHLGLTSRVVMTDWIEDADVPALLNLAELFVFPSLYEGFGLPPLEAMACGTPVICSNASSLPEVVADAGILFNPRDVGALADSIRRVLDNDALCRDLSARGIARARQFTWERAAHETMALYRRVLSR